MSLPSGSRLGAYEVQAPLGAGGMGEVYRARDTRLNREVAIKILPDVFAHDSERVARFTREAQTLASLNHPNIAQIFGVIEEDQPAHVHALVMELVEGEDLSAHIARGPIALAEALPIARQIAEALEAAHEQGVVHRDLKPANVKVRPDGTVKVLDFGLAKALAPEGAGSTADAMHSPTLTAAAFAQGYGAPGTQMGMILGTAAYMAPEQAKGKPIDRRADIWAFGVVLHEMLTGRHLFLADSIPETLAQVMTRPIDLGALPAATPRRVRELIVRCLEKEPKRRLRDIGEARIRLEEVINGVAEEPPAAAAAIGTAPAGSRFPRALPWAIAALAVAAAGWAYLTSGRAPAAPSDEVTYVDIGSLPDVEFVRLSNGGFAISPDGRTVAMIGVKDGARRLFIRSLGRPEAEEVPDTSQMNGMTFSPDGASVAMLDNSGELIRLSLADQRRTPMATGVDTTSLISWSPEGVVFTRAGALWIVTPGGQDGSSGKARALTTLDAARREILHGAPTVLPGGRTVVFASLTSDAGRERIEAVPLAGGARTVLVERADTPVWSPTGHLLFSRDGGVLAVPLDPAVPRVTGPAVPVVPGGAFTQQDGGLTFSLAAAGTLVYAPAGYNTRRVVAVTRDGAESKLDLPNAGYTNPRVSPDGRRLLVARDSTAIEVLDLARGTQMHLAAPALGTGYATWLAGGAHVLFRRFNAVTWVATDGSGNDGVVPNAIFRDWPSAAGPDADSVLVTRWQPDTGADIFLLSITGRFEPRSLIATPAAEGGAQLSPDGRWLLYQSSASGTAEILVRPYPKLDRAFQVSAGGGVQPRWNPATMEICYRSGQRLVAVPFDGRGAEPVVGKPSPLFADDYDFGVNITLANYDITRDGRFVMLRRGPRSGTLRAALHWTDELRRILSAGGVRQ
jgi:Tol biopolymer transport system component